MLIEPSEAEKQLSFLFPERKSSQWKTVVSCLEDLAGGNVIPHYALASVALDLEEESSVFYKKIISRAQKMSNHFGGAGSLEARTLAKVAISSAVSSDKHRNLSAHTARVGFNRKLDPELEGLTGKASINTRSFIRSLSKSVKEFGDFKTQFQAENPAPYISELLEKLVARDNYLHEQLLQRDKTYANTLACITQQISPWEAVNILLDHHNTPCPYEHELIASQSCFFVASDKGKVDLRKLPVIHDDFKTDNTINFPLLSFVTLMQGNSSKPIHAASGIIPLDKFSSQLLLEIIFMRQGGE